METDFMKKYARQAAAGAVLVAMGCVGLYGIIAWGSTPSSTGGIDGAHSTIAYIGAAFPFLAIIAAHLVFARQLSRYGKSE